MLNIYFSSENVTLGSQACLVALTNEERIVWRNLSQLFFFECLRYSTQTTASKTEKTDLLVLFLKGLEYPTRFTIEENKEGNETDIYFLFAPVGSTCSIAYWDKCKSVAVIT